MREKIARMNLSHKTARAMEHGAAWFAAAGVSGFVFLWAVSEIVKKIVQ